MSLLRTFLLYASSSLVLRGITLLITPWTIRLLSPAEYGTLSLIASSITLGSLFAGLGLRQYLSIEYFHATPERKQELITTLCVAYAWYAIPILAGAAVYKDTLFSWLLPGTTLSSGTVFAISITIFCQFFTELALQIAQYEQRAGRRIMLQTINAMMVSAGTLLLLSCTSSSYASQAIAMAGSQLACIGLCLWWCTPWNMELTFPSPITIMRTIGAGIPFVPALISSWIMSFSSRWILARYADLTAVALYSVADLASQLLYLLVIYPWNGAYLPYMMQRFAQSSDIRASQKQNMRTMWLTFASLMVLVHLGYIAGAPIARFVLPSSYHPALSYIPFMLTAQLFLLASYFPAALVQFAKRSRMLILCTSLGTALHLSIGIALAPQYGVWGCIAASCIAQGMQWALMIWYASTLVRSHAALPSCVVSALQQTTQLPTTNSTQFASALEEKKV